MLFSKILMETWRLSTFTWCALNWWKTNKTIQIHSKLVIITKQPNIKLSIWPKPLLGFLTLLPNCIMCKGAKMRHFCSFIWFFSGSTTWLKLSLYCFILYCDSFCKWAQVSHSCELLKVWNTNCIFWRNLTLFNKFNERKFLLIFKYTHLYPWPTNVSHDTEK